MDILNYPTDPTHICSYKCYVHTGLWPHREAHRLVHQIRIDLTLAAAVKPKALLKVHQYGLATASYGLYI